MKIRAVYGDVFAERVIGNLINFKTFCESCGTACAECRMKYGSYVGDIVGVHPVQSISHGIIDNAAHIIDGLGLGECDVLLIVAVNHDVLNSLEMLIDCTDAKAIIVPIEDSIWVPPGLRSQIKARAEDMGIESTFSKPFCTLELGEGKVIDQFISRYKIGRPICYADLSEDLISEIGPVRSAPCGSTWHVCQKVRGKSIMDKDILFDAISKAHHSYPCTASMVKDRELGDALLHIAGYQIRSAVCDAVGLSEC